VGIIQKVVQQKVPQNPERGATTGEPAMLNDGQCCNAICPTKKSKF
jgi:hypothetical protein